MFLQSRLGWRYGSLLPVRWGLRRMLVVAGGSAIALFAIGGLCLVTGHLASGRLAWLSAVSIGGIWVLQKALARSLL